MFQKEGQQDQRQRRQCAWWVCQLNEWVTFKQSDISEQGRDMFQDTLQYSFWSVAWRVTVGDDWIFLSDIDQTESGVPKAILRQANEACDLNPLGR